MKNIFLDTDVVIDFLTDRQPHSKFISEIFGIAAENKITLYATALTLSNTYYVLRKFTTHKSLIDKIEKLTNMIEIINPSKEAILKAVRSNFNDLEDAFQNYTAEEFGKIDILLTRNESDYKNSNIIILSPEEYFNINAQ